MSADGSATPPSAERPLRVAVVGAGPAGIYAADALTRQDDVPVAVDLIDRLPDPVRAGPARHRARPPEDAGDPRHPAPDPRPPARPVRRQRRGRRRHLPRGAAPARRRRHLHLRRGPRPPPRHRRRGPARQPRRHRPRRLVHRAPRRRPRPRRGGAGRRAVGRGRRRRQRRPRRRRGCWPGPPAELESTDMPQHVLDALAATPVEEVTVLGRRGPAQASFTTQELRELDDLRARDRARRPRRPRTRPGAPRSGPRPTATSPGTSPCSAAGPTTCPTPAARRLRLRFFARPVRLLGEDRVTGVEVERTAVDGDGPRRGHRRGRGAARRPRRPLGGLPRHAAARAAGRRAHRNGAPRGRAGAARRPAVARRVRGRLDQARAQRRRRHQQARRPGDRRVAARRRRRRHADGRSGPVGDLVEELVAAGREPVLLDDWRAIDAAEVALGATRGRARTTLHEREALLAAVRAATRPAEPSGERGQQAPAAARSVGGRDEPDPRAGVGREQQRLAVRRSARPRRRRSRTASPPATSCTWLPLRSTSCQAAAEPSATRHRSTAVQPVIRTRRAVAGTTTEPPPGALGTTTVLPARGRTGTPSRRAPAPSAPAQRRPEERSATSPATGRPLDDQRRRERPRRQARPEVAGAVERVEHDPRLARRPPAGRGAPR